MDSHIYAQGAGSGGGGTAGSRAGQGGRRTRTGMFPGGLPQQQNFERQRRDRATRRDR